MVVWPAHAIPHLGCPSLSGTAPPTPVPLLESAALPPWELPPEGGVAEAAEVVAKCAVEVAGTAVAPGGELCEHQQMTRPRAWIVLVCQCWGGFAFPAAVFPRHPCSLQDPSKLQAAGVRALSTRCGVAEGEAAESA